MLVLTWSLLYGMKASAIRGDVGDSGDRKEIPFCNKNKSVKYFKFVIEVIVVDFIFYAYQCLALSHHHTRIDIVLICWTDLEL